MSNVGRAQRRSERGVALLARGPRHADLLEILLFVERQRRHLLTLAVRKRHDVVVEAGNGDAPFAIDQPGQDLRQGVGRIGDRAAERAGVQIAVGAADVKLVVGDAPQAVGDGRHAGGELAAVADHHAIAGQPVGMFGQILLQAVAADLLLALDDELQVQRQPALDGDPGLGAFQMGEHLALVVRGARGRRGCRRGGWARRAG